MELKAQSIFPLVFSVARQTSPNALTAAGDFVPTLTAGLPLNENVAAFRYCVPGIVSRRSCKQMIRIHATPGIAAMADIQPVRDRAVNFSPCPPVSEDEFGPSINGSICVLSDAVTHPGDYSVPQNAIRKHVVIVPVLLSVLSPPHRLDNPS